MAIIHAQRADRTRNVLIEGIIGVQKEAALAATKVIVTVEEVVEAPGGALPSYTRGYYRRDNAFYTAWDGISRNRETFLSRMQEHVL